MPRVAPFPPRAVPVIAAVALIAGVLWAAYDSAFASDDPLEYRLTAPMLAKDDPLPETYVTRPGQTLAMVATLFGTRVDVLLRLNDLPPYEPLPTGTEVFAPKPPPPPPVLPCEDLLGPVSKDHGLPENCTPWGLQQLPWLHSYGGAHTLDPRAADAFEELATDALSAGHHLLVRSAYRSYSEQEFTFAHWVNELGYEQAFRVSPPPGHSEHQLGTAVDVTTAIVDHQLTTGFGATAAGQWMSGNAWRYGFVMSYPDGKEHITGYAYEPWHYRWVGVDAATEVRDRGITLYEYLLDAWLPGRYLFDIY